MKEKINVFEYSREILEALNKGILITSKYEDKVNTMTISWGALGIEWSKPMFTIYVREHRFTKSLLDKNPEFTKKVFSLDKGQVSDVFETPYGYEIVKVTDKKTKQKSLEDCREEIVNRILAEKYLQHIEKLKAEMNAAGFEIQDL